MAIWLGHCICEPPGCCYFPRLAVVAMLFIVLVYIDCRDHRKMVLVASDRRAVFWQIRGCNVFFVIAPLIYLCF